MFKVLPPSAVGWLLVAARRKTGLSGMGLRYALLAALGATRGDNISIREDVFLLGVGGLQIGANVSIHPLCYLDATGGLSLGRDVSIAHNTTILSTTHNYDSLDSPIKDQGVRALRTVVEDDCWIGAQCTIVAGVTVGAGSVVAANSVVTRDVPPRSVVAGSPAQVLKTRGHDRA